MEGKGVKVSVIVPHYNMQKRLPSAIKSVQAQTYRNLELLVVDDGSEWKLDPLLLSASTSIPLRLLSISHGGKPTAVNQGFRCATGSYFVILDADDELPCSSIEKRLTALLSQNADLCVGSFFVRYNDALTEYRKISKLASEKLVRDLLTSAKSPVHQNSMMFSRNLLLKTGFMNTRYIRSQDTDYAIRLLRNSCKTVFVRKPVYVYNRYYRPAGVRVRNRWLGMKFKLRIIAQNSCGWRLIAYLMWGVAIETVKLCYFLCRSRY